MTSTLATQLKQAFPWLGTDDIVNGGDAVDTLNDLYEQLLNGGDEAPMALDERETSTVLHALRILQEIRGDGAGMVRNGCFDAQRREISIDHSSCDHFENLGESLNNEEIDDLCERLNFHDVGAKAPAQPEPEDAQAILDRVADLQTQYWDALSELEAAVGFDVDSGQELAGRTVEELKHEGDDD